MKKKLRSVFANELLFNVNTYHSLHTLFTYLLNFKYIWSFYQKENVFIL